MGKPSNENTRWEINQSFIGNEQVSQIDFG